MMQLKTRKESQLWQEKQMYWCNFLCIPPGAVKLVLRHYWMHVIQVHPVMSEKQFHCTRLWLPLLCLLMPLPSSDQNECLLHPCDAKETCTNTIGSFRCQCKPGYARKGTKNSCYGEARDQHTFFFSIATLCFTVLKHSLQFQKYTVCSYFNEVSNLCCLCHVAPRAVSVPCCTTL